jgi:dTDP-4-dehydrorhamnose reductase
VKTVCITGGNGLLGSKLLKEGEGKYKLVSIDLHDAPLFHFAGMDYIQGNITDAGMIRDVITRTRPDCVFHTAAYTDVDRCELEKENCWHVNVSGTEQVVSACSSQRIKLVFLSTDYIFDGTKGPYSEEDEPCPVSHYGTTKWESEKTIRSRLDDYIIARTTVLYGYFPGVRPNFITWLVEKLKKNQTVSIVEDQYGTPTLADDLAKDLLILFQKNKTGVFNTVGSECLSRYDFALRVAEVFDLERTLILKTTTNQLKQVAPRPMHGGLTIEKVIHEAEGSFSGVVEGLMTMRAQMEKDGAF